MRWSIRLGRLWGIDVRIHVTFLVLLAWIAWTQYRATSSISAATGALLSVLLVFVSVLLHEYGHALVARRYGIPTKDITLLPIGGVAQLERMPEDPKGELAVSIAGPAVNAVIAAALFTTIYAVGRLDLPAHPNMPGGTLLAQLAWINVTLAVFNLIPAFPMDGGRVLRALLAMKMGHPRATQIAATLGQGLALVAGVVGLFWNPLLLFVALFVWLGASEEGKTNMLSLAMEGIPVQFAMVKSVRAVPPEAPLDVAVEHILGGFQQDLPVVRRDKVVGVLTRQDILRALSEHGAAVPIADVMRTDFTTAHPSEMLATAHRRMQERDCNSLPVVMYDGRIVGMLTMDSIGELLLVRAALREHQASDAAPPQ